MPSGHNNREKFRFPSVTVLTASAGAGKTYALTHRYVRLLLSDAVPHNALQNVLAITFTNNAAAEMKQRILTVLKLAAFGDPKTLEELRGGLSSEPGEIQSKAAWLVDTILENYSDFQVKTIDSFMSTVFKSSSLDYGYHPDFEILLNADRIFDLAFATFSKEVKKGSPHAHVIENIVGLVSESRGADGSFVWNPYRDIASHVKTIYRSIVGKAKPLSAGNSSGSSSLLLGEIKRQAMKVEDLIHTSGLSISALFAADLAHIKAGDVHAMIERKLRPAPVNKPKGGAETAAYEKWIGELGREHQRLNDLLRRFILVYAEEYYRPYAEAFAMMQPVVERLKRQERQIFIDDVSRTLAQHLTEQAVPDIYFKIGETIYHYLIDEFQDTSQIQWNNLFPLVEESLSKGGSIFVVGDTKQSIYGFREADWRIMKDLEEKNPFPSAAHDVRSLEMNYRSFEKIVTFTKEIFRTSIPAAGYDREAAASGLSGFEQQVIGEHAGRGYVEVDIFENAEDNPYEKHWLYDIVRDCRSRGYRYNDIAVLTPTNDHVIEVSGWLNARRIPIISHSTLDVRRRKSAGEFIALLRFLDSPVDDLSFATFILGDVFRNALAKKNDHHSADEFPSVIAGGRMHNTGPLYTEFRARYGDLWDEYFEHLFNVVGYFPLYDLLSEAYKIFDVFNSSPGEEASLVKLLEVVKTFEQQGMNTMKNFFEYSSDASADSVWEINVPKDLDALQVMTVHKAKGMEFPVVIVLLYDRSPRGKSFLLRDNEDSVSILKVNKKIAENVDELRELMEAEEFRDRVDGFNQLYVAFTRAEEEMYVIGVYKKGPQEPTKFLPRTGYSPAPKPSVTPKKPRPENVVSPFHHTVRKSLGIQAYRSFGAAETKRGDFVHRVFSLIGFIGSDIDGQVEALVARVSREMALETSLAGIGSLVRECLRDGTVREWFVEKEGRRVLREQDLTNRDGDLYRADRIIIDPNTVTVIDFKTGGDESEGEYIVQVRNYMGMLKEIYPSKDIRGRLLYVDLKTVRSVS